jgi:hypothetical protein
MGAGAQTRALIDRTNDGLSGMPADGISLPVKGETSARPAGAGSRVRLHQPRDWAEGGMTVSFGEGHQWLELTSGLGGWAAPKLSQRKSIVRSVS